MIGQDQVGQHAGFVDERSKADDVRDALDDIGDLPRRRRREHRIDVVNPAFARMHGWDNPDTLSGRAFVELLPAEQRGEPLDWSSAMDVGLAYESTHLRADGSTFPVLTNVMSLGAADGVRAYVVTLQDLAPLKRAEERLRRAVEVVQRPSPHDHEGHNESNRDKQRHL